MAFIAACDQRTDSSSHSSNHSSNYDHQLTERDIQFLSSFSLSALPPLPAVASNQYADDEQAAKLGKDLFFDPRLSSNGEVSCASCHQPEKYFTDGLPTAQGIGQTKRNAMTLLGAARGPWKYWDGRKDSLWSQALEPLEAPEEHGFSRQQVEALIGAEYQQQYAAVFGAPKNSATNRSEQQSTQVMVNVGKAMMAYQRKLTLQPARFDRMIQALREQAPVAEQDRLNTSELNGLRLFMGKAACASCHNGPLFTNFEFHNIGAPEANELEVDLGRYAGIEKLRSDEFNCRSQWSDATKLQCRELNFLKEQGPELVGAFKTPSLRNVSHTAPYMQSGQIATLPEVVAHYSAPKPPFYDREQHPSRPHFDILPLGLTAEEQADLVAFLGTLLSPLPTDDPWWPVSEGPLAKQPQGQH